MKLSLSTYTLDYRRILDIFVILGSLKLLLFHAYKSTDFEVHRNWMAITYELPLKEWYFEKTSEWTLDYPPFFAYFEWILGQIAGTFVDREMVRVQNLNYNSWSVVYYQRASVIVSDLVFLYGCYLYFQAETKSNGGKFDLLRLAFNYGSAALIFLDNIHFQYNSMMYGLMILSIALIKESSYFKSAFVFAVLLNFKHIYLYCAPCFGIIYLKKAVFNQPSLGKSITNFILLGLQTLLVFTVSFGPFILVGGKEQLIQIASRLFPFQRGLVHYYWAANAWANYVFYNKYVVNLYATLTTGKWAPPIFEVDQAHDLTTYKQWCMIGTFSFLIPMIVMMFWKLNKRNFLFYLAATNFIVFNFGFHVHEKAILMTVLPLMLDTHRDSSDFAKARLLVLKTVALWTLLPLLISPNELVVKHALLILDTLLTTTLFLRLPLTTLQPLLLRLFLYLVFVSIALLQLVYLLYIEVYLGHNDRWMCLYQDFLPAIATVFNQVVFIEMVMYRGMIRPESIGREEQEGEKIEIEKIKYE